MPSSAAPPQADLDDSKLALQIGPPVRLPVTPRRDGEALEAWLLRLPGTAEHRAVSESLKGIGTSGSPRPELQAILYQLLRELRPKTALEIGTLFAGTTHVIARALWANGEGRVTTIDPFGGERVPAIIARMPPEIGGRIDFYPLSSMDFFLRRDVPRGSLDFAFIDGDHSYPGAHFDLYRTSERVKPNGVIVMDNAYLCGVANATADFLESNPDWRAAGHEPGGSANLREVGRVASRIGPLGMLVLFAPPYIRVGKFPLEDSIRNINAGPYERMRLELHGESPPGVVEFWFYFVARDFNFHKNGIVAADAVRRDKIQIAAGATVVEIPFETVLLNASPRENNIQLEYELRFLASDGVSGLALAAAPALL